MYELYHSTRPHYTRPPRLSATEISTLYASRLCPTRSGIHHINPFPLPPDQVYTTTNSPFLMEAWCKDCGWALRSLYYSGHSSHNPLGITRTALTPMGVSRRRTPPRLPRLPRLAPSPGRADTAMHRPGMRPSENTAGLRASLPACIKQGAARSSNRERCRVFSVLYGGGSAPATVLRPDGPVPPVPRARRPVHIVRGRRDAGMPQTLGGGATGATGAVRGRKGLQRLPMEGSGNGVHWQPRCAALHCLVYCLVLGWAVPRGWRDRRARGRPRRLVVPPCLLGRW